jgi:hypothetical protein
MLELQGLTRRYGDLVALDDLSFTVTEGQMFGFVGSNGAGKTTAMRIILGVLAPDAGEVRWRGRPMTDEIRKRLGYLPEDHGQTFSTQCARIQGTAAANPLPARLADSTPTNRSALSLRQGPAPRAGGAGCGQVRRGQVALNGQAMFPFRVSDPTGRWGRRFTRDTAVRVPIVSATRTTLSVRRCRRGTRRPRWRRRPGGQGSPPAAGLAVATQGPARPAAVPGDQAQAHPRCLRR